jgi:hypothetical protein
LDFDGVLNSAEWMEKNQEAIKTGASLLVRDAAEIDPTALARVRRIVETTGAKIVISSSWRLLHSLREIFEIVEHSGWIDPPIIGITPKPFRGGVRGHEVQAWLVEHPKVTKYVCLDDDSDFLPGQNLIQTSWDTGIQDTHVEMAIEQLKD